MHRLKSPMAAGWRSHGPGGGPPAAHGFLRGQHHGKRSLALGLPRISHRLIGQSVCHHRCLVSYLRRLELTKSVMIVGSAPASISGIASALAPVALQVCLFSPIKLSSKAVQIGCVMDLAVQAGLLTIKPGGLNNYTNLQAAFRLQLGWVDLDIALLLILFRRGKTTPQQL